MAAFVAAPLVAPPLRSTGPAHAGGGGRAVWLTPWRVAGQPCGRLRRRLLPHLGRGSGAVVRLIPLSSAGAVGGAEAPAAAAATAAAASVAAAADGEGFAPTVSEVQADASPPPAGACVPAASDDAACGRPRLGLGGTTPGREEEFLSKIGTSKSQSVTTLEKESTERSFGTVLQELAAIQADGPRNVAILGTRHASYLHQQIIELLTYANVLVGNHVFTSGAAGTNYAVIKGALRAEKPDLLTVVLPQSMRRQPAESQVQLKKVKNLVELSKNDSLPLDYASQLCNSDILSRCTHFIAFAFHDSDVILESAREAKALGKVATLMFLD